MHSDYHKWILNSGFIYDFHLHSDQTPQLLTFWTLLFLHSIVVYKYSAAWTFAFQLFIELKISVSLVIQSLVSSHRSDVPVKSVSCHFARIFHTHTNTRTSLWFNNSLSDDPFYQLLLIHFQSLIACSRNDRNLFHFPQAFFSERCKFAS